MSAAIQGWVVVGGVAALALNYLGLLDWLKPKSSADVAGELEIADRTRVRAQAERDAALLRVKELELQRTNAPVIDLLEILAAQLGQNSETQAAVMDRLASHNGAFKHMEESLGSVSEGLKVITGWIAEMNGIEVRK